MKIGILGSGQVGKVLAHGFLKYGNQVMLASRDPLKLEEWLQEAGSRAKTGDFTQTAAFGEMLVLAVAGRVASAALDLAGAGNLAGKTIIDATNPISSQGPENGVLRFFTDINYSLMEILQDRFPEAHFVKAFSCIGNAHMVDPDFPEGKPTMFIGGNSQKAKEEVTAILEQFGHDVADMGGAEAARAIEPLCILWCIPGFLHNQWNHAFRMIRAS